MSRSCWVQVKYEPGDRVEVLIGSFGKGWEPAKVVRRFEVRSITEALLGYKYIVLRDGYDGYGDNVTYHWQVRG
jgi:hypothetical protein